MSDTSERNSSAPVTWGCPKCLGIGFTTIKATTTVAEQYLSCDCVKGRGDMTDTSTDVQRYSVTENRDGMGFSNGIESDVQGDYVAHSDYAAMAAERDALQSANETLTLALREVRDRNNRRAGLRDTVVQQICRSALKQAAMLPTILALKTKGETP